MEWLKTITKALQGGVTTVAGLLAGQLAAHQGLVIDWVVTSVAAIVSGLIVGVTNWLKHRAEA